MCVGSPTAGYIVKDVSFTIGGVTPSKCAQFDSRTFGDWSGGGVGSYGPNENCYINFTTTPGCMIRFQFTYLDINPTGDRLTIGEWFISL